jgi:hypothetical protein
LATLVEKKHPTVGIGDFVVQMSVAGSCSSTVEDTKVSRKFSGEQFLSPDLIIDGSSVAFIEVKKFATNGLYYRD